MITSSREKGFQAKQEGETNDGKFSKGPTSSTSRQWSGFRNPRIVRVSRSFGGKDRHSKVCTIRGLRDRRIRLSVPTAIQLYDLQDRLGLSQPSKVIDWLLDATKNDIDKLPPLQMPPGFGQFHQQMLVSHESNTSSQSSLAPFFDANPMFIKDGEEAAAAARRYWDMDAAAVLRAKGKEVVERESTSVAEKGKWIKVTDQQQENEDEIGDYSGQQASSQKLFPSANHSSLPGFWNNAMPFNSYHHWDPSSLSLSQFGNHAFLPQTENFLSTTVPLPSSLALPAAHTPQLFFCPPSTMPSLFPTYPSYATPGDSSDDSRQINHFQLLSSNSQHILPNSVTAVSSPMAMKPFSLNVNAGLSSTRTENNDHESHADDEDNMDS